MKKIDKWLSFLQLLLKPLLYKGNYSTINYPVNYIKQKKILLLSEYQKYILYLN